MGAKLGKNLEWVAGCELRDAGCELRGAGCGVRNETLNIHLHIHLHYANHLVRKGCELRVAMAAFQLNLKGGAGF